MRDKGSEMGGRSEKREKGGSGGRNLKEGCEGTVADGVGKELMMMMMMMEKDAKQNGRLDAFRVDPARLMGIWASRVL